MRALPPRQRQVLALVIDGWPPGEIAELLGGGP
jgi:DNA-directed RNA polymerase specialized sigma24 family protein